MTSIFRTAMGDAAFERLHPELQRRFSVGLASGELCVGRGVMDRIWHGRAAVKPFLAVAGLRNILLPRTGRNVPFTIENVPYTDSYGRETVTFVRTFALSGGPRRFDATMVHSPERDCVLDYLGTHQHLASDLHLSAEPDGSLLIRSGEHRFREGPLDVRVPEPVGGRAEVRESFDERTGRFRINVRVDNRYFGPLFGYRGSFTAEYADVRSRGCARGCARCARRYGHEPGRAGPEGGGAPDAGRAQPGDPGEAARRRPAHPRRTGHRQVLRPRHRHHRRGQPGPRLLPLRLRRRTARRGLPARRRAAGGPPPRAAALRREPQRAARLRTGAPRGGAGGRARGLPRAAARGGAGAPRLVPATAAGLDLWIAEIEQVLVRVLAGSPLAEFTDPAGLARAVGASFVGLELYEGVDPAGAEAAFGALEQLGALMAAVEELNPVARKAVTYTLRRQSGRAR